MPDRRHHGDGHEKRRREREVEGRAAKLFLDAAEGTVARVEGDRARNQQGR
jgi:hypothetical protein